MGAEEESNTGKDKKKKQKASHCMRNEQNSFQIKKAKRKYYREHEKKS